MEGQCSAVFYYGSVKFVPLLPICVASLHVLILFAFVKVNPFLFGTVLLLVFMSLGAVFDMASFNFFSSGTLCCFDHCAKTSVEKWTFCP